MASTAADDRSLPPESIPTVDLRLLSQSELYALSLCSASAFDPHRTDDVVIPKIDRTVFNESAGSRKQTYSRLRLAPASSSFASICRRTPHLRIPKPSSVETDPERAENSKIVAMLKALFSSESSGNGVVSIPPPVVYTAPAPIQVESNRGDDSVKSNADLNNSMMSVGIKQKRGRGRPRKDENGVVPAKIEIRDIFIYDNAVKREDNVVSYLLNNSNTMKRKRGRGRPRKDGTIPMVVVPERNEMKEVVVYDNYVENDKDVLSSSNDKEILNTKGVVVDVLALASMEDPFGPEIRRRTEGMSTDAELLGFLEGLGGRWGSRRRKRKVVDASLFGDYLPKGWNISISLKRKEKQVWLFCRRYISPSGRQFISCKEISSYLMSLSGLLDNKQPDSSHAGIMDSQNPAGHAVLGNNKKDNLTEGNNYDSHVRNHMSNEVSGVPESIHEHVQESVDLSSVGGIPNEDTVVNKDIILETFDKDGNDELYPGIHKYKPEKSSRMEISSDKPSYDQLHEAYGNPDFQTSQIGLNRVEASDEVKTDSHFSSHKVDDIAGITDKRALESNVCLGFEETMSTNDNNSIRDTSDRINILQSVSDTLHVCSVEQESGLQISDAPQMNDKICVPLEGNNIGDSAAANESIKEGVPRNVLYTENMSSTSTIDDLKLIAGKVAATESISGSNNNHTALDKHRLTAVEQHINVEGAVFPSRNEQFSSIVDVRFGGLDSKIAMSEQKVCSKSSVPILSSDEATCADKNVESVSTFSVAPNSYAESHTDMVDGLEDERKYGDFPLVSSLSQRNQTTLAVEPGQRVSLSSLLSLSGHEQDCSTEMLVDLLPATNVDSTECNDVETCRNNEVIFSSGRTYSDVGGSMTSDKQRSLELSSLLSSGKGTLLGAECNVAGVDNRSVEECSRQYSEAGLLPRSCFAENPSNIYADAKIYNRPVNELRFHNGQNSTNHDLALAFGNAHAGVYGVTTDLEHERYPANCTSLPVRIEQNFDSQVNVNRVSDNFVEEQVGSFSDLFSLSCNGKLWGSEQNFNHGYNKRWEVPEANEVGTSKNKKHMVDFGGNNAQPGGMWRGGEDSFQSNMADLSNPPLQSPTSFCNFDILSDKVEDGLYRVGEKYDRESCFEGLESGRTEPVEFSFLTAPNSNSFQGDSVKNTYDPGMGQPFDSSYWLGKHDMVQNISSRSQITTLCVWCRNEFHHEPVHSGTQAAIGSLCPTCRTRISEQVNAL